MSDPFAVLTAATHRLRDAGVASPAHDARELLAAAAGLPVQQLPVLSRLDDAAAGRFAALVDRRARREPLQHILGSTGFRFLDLLVGPGVFIPRPETEVLVQAAIDGFEKAGPATVVDLCAGSGAIGLSIAIERPRTSVWAVEASEAAVTWMRRNVEAQADRLVACGSEVRVVHAAVADAASATGALRHLAGRVDVVASNPPYIPDDARPRDPEVLDHDPAMALFGGADGLDVVREVVQAAAVLLRTRGRVLIEHGDLQGHDAGAAGVPAVFASWSGHGHWGDVVDHEDLTGRPRFTTAEWMPAESPTKEKDS